MENNLLGNVNTFRSNGLNSGVRKPVAQHKLYLSAKVADFNLPLFMWFSNLS